MTSPLAVDLDATLVTSYSEKRKRYLDVRTLTAPPGGRLALACTSDIPAWFGPRRTPALGEDLDTKGDSGPVDGYADTGGMDPPA
jgi:hypothetical protein